MGAAPSRETAEHRLSQPPFYGQRQRIVLIPLLKRFFPSPDCSLFVQLYEAQCDPTVRYYCYANASANKVQAMPTSPVSSTVSTTPEGVGNVASSNYLAEVVGSAPAYCPPADVFPAVSWTREAMYDAYITNGGEKMVYETDEEMLRAYRADATSVRPLPCAVAFLYHRPPSAASYTTLASARDASNGRGARSALTTGAASGGAHSFPEDCTELLGVYVKATGFIGDVRGLGASRARKLQDYEMQMFLIKSAGDHHCTHVLITAVYTYAEQWQRACLHCVPCDLAMKELAPVSTQDSGTADKDLGDVFFYYKPFSQPHDMFVEASRTAGHHRVGKAAAAEGSEEGGGTFKLEETVQFWAPPPLPSLVIRSRRANVSLLCFLREVRTCVRSFFLFHFKHYLDHQDSLKLENSEGRGGADSGEDWRTEKTCPINPLDRRAGERHFFHMPPPGSAQMWLQEATRVTLPLTEDGCEGTDMDTESMLNFYLMAPYVLALVEFIVVCLLHNINPLELFRLSSEPDDLAMAAASAGCLKKGLTTTREAPAADPVGDDASFLNTAAMMAGSPTLQHSLSFIRLPDENMLVQPWPPSSTRVEASGEASSTIAAAGSSTGAGILSAWRSRHTDHHLFWSVGPDVVNRRSATAALLHWYTTEKAPVVWGYSLDEKGHDAVADGKKNAIVSCNVSAQVFPSLSLESYMSTVTVNGHTEELLRCNTVLCLVRLEAETPAEARVLRVCSLPLEELLLGELRNACKLAREASPEDPHWVRQREGTSGDGGSMKYAGCVLHASDPAEGESRTVIPSKGVEPSVVLPEADGIIGDGASCLWRVNLIEDMCRIIAVTPWFLKASGKRHHKKKLQSKAVFVPGTAPEVFLAAASSSPAATLSTPAPSATTKPPPKDGGESKAKVTPPVRAPMGAAPNRQEPAALGEEKSGGTLTVLGLLATDAAITTATASAASTTKAKKAQKAVSAAAALVSASTPTAVELRTESEAASPAAVSVESMVATVDVAAMATQPETTKWVKTTPAENWKKAEVAKEKSPVVVTYTGAATADKQGESSPPSTSTLAAAIHAEAATAEKAKGAKEGDGASGSSTVGVTGTTITSTAAHATTLAAGNLNKAPTLLRSLQPPMPAGEHDPSRKSNKVGAGRKYRAPSTMSSTGSGSETACALQYSPGYNPYFSLPLYDVYPPPPPLPPPLLQLPPPSLLRGLYEQNGYTPGYSYRGLPPPPGFTDPHSSAKTSPSYGGYYYVSDEYELPAGYDGSCNNSPSNAAWRYNTRMSSGATGITEVAKQMFGDECVNLPYVYATPPPQLQSQRQHAGTAESSPGEDFVSFVQPYSLPANAEGHCYEAGAPVGVAADVSLTRQENEMSSFIVAPGSQRTASISFRDHLSFEADIDGSKGGMADITPLSSPRRRGVSFQCDDSPCGGSSVSMSFVPINIHRHSHHYSTAAPPPLPLQSPGTCSHGMSNTCKDCPNASARTTASPPLLQRDESISAFTNSSGTLLVGGQHWHHTRYASSPYQTGCTIMEGAGVLCGEGGGPADGTVNVTVRVRHSHNRTHSHAGSYFSDATTDQASAQRYHHDRVHSTNCSTSVASGGGFGAGATSLTGTQISHSCASLEPASIVFPGASGGGSGSVCERSSAKKGDRHYHVSASCERDGRQSRHHGSGVAASSTRSGDTPILGRLADKRTRTYRWDWRMASLDIGDDD
ncbi:hypothetical protein MNV84_06271 [Leishmania braziliensis]|nr:hypothetical protein MNV84_06271 [Leishmania braziliensis]